MINDEAIKQAQIVQNGATTPSQQESCRWVAIESRVVPSVLDGPEERFFEQRRMIYQDNNTKDLLSADALGCSFPFKLHRLLNAAHAQGLESIVSWTPDGNGFKVHNVEQFVKNILPQFFSKQTKYKSFQRQLVGTRSTMSGRQYSETDSQLNHCCLTFRLNLIFFTECLGV